MAAAAVLGTIPLMQSIFWGPSSILIALVRSKLSYAVTAQRMTASCTLSQYGA
jgi:hypothetical protein